MKVIDLHCDTLSHCYAHHREELYELPEAMLDLVRMQQGGVLAQFFAIYMPPPGEEYRVGRTQPIDDDEYIDSCIKILHTTLERHSELLTPALSAQDILRGEAEGRMSALLALEDGRAVRGSLARLREFYDRGVRLISLTWNFENCFGAPNSNDPATMARGLTDFGKEAVCYMNELGMLVDVSHLSDGGFYDVARLCSRPFVASHSNLRSLSPHRRNLTDEMLRLLGEKGGVAGLNYCPAFLNADITCPDSTLERMSAHLRRMIDLGGVECVALGSDFDGIHGNLELADVAAVPRLFDRLQRDGLSQDSIEKLAYGNALRVIREGMR